MKSLNIDCCWSCDLKFDVELTWERWWNRSVNVVLTGRRRFGRDAGGTEDKETRGLFVRMLLLLKHIVFSHVLFLWAEVRPPKKEELLPPPWHLVFITSPMRTATRSILPIITTWLYWKYVCMCEYLWFTTRLNPGFNTQQPSFKTKPTRDHLIGMSFGFKGDKLMPGMVEVVAEVRFGGGLVAMKGSPDAC